MTRNILFLTKANVGPKSFSSKLNYTLPLIGIHPNPGPVTSIVRVGAKSNAEQGRRVLKVQKKPKKKNRRLRRQNQIGMIGKGRNNSAYGMIRSRDAASYAAVLANPFDCQPVRLGADCMMPTGLATCSLRINVVPASTYQSYVIYPRARDTVLGSNTVSTPYTYTSVSSLPQAAQLASVAAGARIVAAGLRVMTSAAANVDNGILTVGCLPRETSQSADPTITNGGFPVYASSTATQGYNEFFNYLQTESYPLRNGATVFYRPQDPADFTFKDNGLINNTYAYTEQIMPFFVVGLSGSTASQPVMLEIVIHYEYTISENSAGVIGSGQGNMSQNDVTQVSRSVFPNFNDTTIAGVIGGLDSLLTGGQGRRAYNRLLEQASGMFFGSTNNNSGLLQLDYTPSG